jgi:hypothetical protein
MFKGLSKSLKHKKHSQLSKGAGYGPALPQSQLNPMSQQVFDNSADWDLPSCSCKHSALRKQNG